MKSLIFFTFFDLLLFFFYFCLIIIFSDFRFYFSNNWGFYFIISHLSCVDSIPLIKSPFFLISKSCYICFFLPPPKQTTLNLIYLDWFYVTRIYPTFAKLLQNPILHPSPIQFPVATPLLFF